MAPRLDGITRLSQWLPLSLLAVVPWAAVAWSPRSVGPSDRIEIQVLFSPNDGCQDRIVREIGEAERRICVQAYQFTSKPIGDALAKARRSGVEVQVILDQSQEKQSYARWRVLSRAGIKVRFDAQHKIANNKIILIDDRTIITGSYNFTKAAEEENAENLLIIRNAPDLFSQYLANFQKHLEHSRRP